MVQAGEMFYFSPLPFLLQSSQSINNLHNFSPSIFNAPDKGLFSYRSLSVWVWCVLLWNSPQTQTVPRGFCLCVCVCVLPCLCTMELCAYYFCCTLQVCLCLYVCWVFPYIRERAQSPPKQVETTPRPLIPHSPQIAYSRSISGEGKKF